MELSLVVLAAGVGSRYGGLKQLQPVGPNGETLLEYSVFDAVRAGFSRVVLVVRPETEALFRRAFFDGMARRVPLVYVHQTLTDRVDGFAAPPERDRPWGTGQAVLVAEPEVHGAFAVINADDFYGAQSYLALSAFLVGIRESQPPEFAMMGFRMGQTLTEAGPASRAVCRFDNEGHLESIIEIAELWKRGKGGVYVDDTGKEVMVAGEELVSMNMWGFTRDLFPLLVDRFEDFVSRESQVSDSEFLIPAVIQSLLREGRIRVQVLHEAGQWCGITYPEDRQRVAEAIAAMTFRGEYPEKLWE